MTCNKTLTVVALGKAGAIVEELFCLVALHSLLPCRLPGEGKAKIV
jgi:hypothetical protein